MRSSTARWIRSQIPKPYGLITIVPRASDGSARPPCFTTSWYQPGKSSDCFGSAMRGSVTAGRARVAGLGGAPREDRVQLLPRLFVELLRGEWHNEADAEAAHARDVERGRALD